MKSMITTDHFASFRSLIQKAENSSNMDKTVNTIYTVQMKDNRGQ